jgi:hypothetical protein
MVGPYHDLPVFSRLAAGTPNYADVFRPLRTLISLTVLAGMVWFSFAVELGDKTLAEHVDTISATPEAKQLLEGTRQTIDPALADVRDRMLGEYVEAPTRIAHEDQVLAGSSAASVEAPEPVLPGRRRARAEASDAETSVEPARPGRTPRRLRPNALVVVEPAPVPIETPAAPVHVPWPRSTSEDDRSFLGPIFERARSMPAAPEPTPIPIVQPVIDPEFAELPGSR